MEPNLLPDQVPPAAEFGALISYLAQQGTLTAEQVRAAIGAGPNGRTRSEIAAELTAWLKERPAA